MSIQGLLDMAQEYFAEIQLIDVAKSSHSKFNRLELSADSVGAAEVLIVARN